MKGLKHCTPEYRAAVLAERAFIRATEKFLVAAKFDKKYTHEDNVTLATRIVGEIGKRTA